MYFEDSEGNYIWNPSKLRDAHTWCKERTEHWMEWSIKYYLGTEPFKMFITNTFTQEWEMEDYFKLAEQYGYQVVSLIVENRHGNKNIHSVPDEKIEQMKERFQIKL